MLQDYVTFQPSISLTCPLMRHCFRCQVPSIDLTTLPSDYTLDTLPEELVEPYSSRVVFEIQVVKICGTKFGEDLLSACNRVRKLALVRFRVLNSCIVCVHQRYDQELRRVSQQSLMFETITPFYIFYSSRILPGDETPPLPKIPNTNRKQLLKLVQGNVEQPTRSEDILRRAYNT